MSIILEHPDAQVRIDSLSKGKKRISVNLSNKSMFIPRRYCETSYPIELIRLILDIKGPAWLCNEIMRDEGPSHVQKSLEDDILGYVDRGSFDNKRVLDFGCGGASTMVLAKMFPRTQIVGIELDSKLLSIAKFRAKYYGFHNIKFILSPSGVQLPKGIEQFDFVILSAVYEHLLPDERKIIMPQIWSIIKPGGVLFLNQAPYRYWPIEMHTTGLLLINYFPDRMTLAIARKFSKRIENNDSWKTLLRKGIRGGTEREIMSNICRKCKDKPILLKPIKPGLNDRIDMWYKMLTSNRFTTIKLLIKGVFKTINFIFGITFLSYLSLAIKKSNLTNGEK